jgi:hypothetical protein
VLVGVAACRRPGAHPVEALEVRLEAPAGEGGRAVLSEGDLGTLLKARISAHGRYRLPDPQEGVGDLRARGVHLRLTVSQGEGRLWLGLESSRRLATGERARFLSSARELLPSEGKGEERALEGRVLAVLERGIDRTLDDAALHLDALDAPDDTLTAQLRARDEPRGRAALRVLTLRRHPAALKPWMARLESRDDAKVREAVGALVDLKDPRAVPALIELGRRGQSRFLREVIFALESIGGDEAEGYLHTMAQGHDEAWVRAAAETALQTVAARQGEER